MTLERGTYWKFEMVKGKVEWCCTLTGKVCDDSGRCTKCNVPVVAMLNQIWEVVNND